jgi:hydrogenase/urease accessory protein HupE
MSAVFRLILRLGGVLLALFLVLPNAQAHESRPAYLELKETTPGQFSVLWRTPVLSGARLPVVLQLPPEVRELHGASIQDLNDSLLERHTIATGPEGLSGKRIEFPGLQLTITDVLVRVERLDGSHSTELVRPSRPWIEFTAPRGALATAGAFLLHGIEHILLGVDHLLFVLGLLLLVRSPWMLLKTITAFTLAHSITLGLATLGYVSFPVPPTEAAIALSILFLGPEIIRARHGDTSFTIRHPWLVAFAFGLLHGFGFASGLAEIGLPQSDIPLALLMFNLGVEIGQLAFVGLMLALARAMRALKPRWPRPVELIPAYAVGSLGAFWTIQRMAGMFGAT